VGERRLAELRADVTTVLRSRTPDGSLPGLRRS
jgi:hypothetical protein